jgi:hypothetical protein
VDVDDLSILGEHGKNVALSELKGKPAHEDVGGVLEPVVPGGLVGEAQVDLRLGNLLSVFDLRERVHGARQRRRTPQHPFKVVSLVQTTLGIRKSESTI